MAHYKDQQNSIIQQEIDNAVSKMTEEDFQLMKDQLKNKPPSDPSTLKILKSTDLDQKVQPVKHYIRDGIYAFPQVLNGLVYIRVLAHFPIVPENFHRLFILSELMSKLGGGGLSEADFSIQSDLYTGGIFEGVNIYFNFDDSEHVDAVLESSISCLKENLDQALKLFKIVLFEPNFDNLDQMKKILEIKNQNYSYWMSRRSSYFLFNYAHRHSSRSGVFHEYLNISITTLREIQKMINEDIHDISNQMKSLFS